jgi:hypothetical protein
MLKSALETNDSDLAFESVRLIMDWGQVYYPRGPRQHNKSSVEKLYSNGILVNEIIHNFTALNLGNYKDVTLMNAGWTKVYTALDPQNFVMLDSRVSFSFSKLLQLYQNVCNGNEIGCTYGKEFKSEFRQVGAGKRLVEDIEKGYSAKRPWARSMLFTSKVLKDVVALAIAKGMDIFGGNPQNLRGLEARLFMEGK